MRASKRKKTATKNRKSERHPKGARRGQPVDSPDAGEVHFKASLTKVKRWTAGLQSSEVLSSAKIGHEIIACAKKTGWTQKMAIARFEAEDGPQSATAKRYIAIVTAYSLATIERLAAQRRDRMTQQFTVKTLYECVQAALRQVQAGLTRDDYDKAALKLFKEAEKENLSSKEVAKKFKPVPMVETPGAATDGEEAAPDLLATFRSLVDEIGPLGARLVRELDGERIEEASELAHRAERAIGNLVWELAEKKGNVAPVVEVAEPTPAEPSSAPPTTAPPLMLPTD